jgi:hypothetical protein
MPAPATSTYARLDAMLTRLEAKLGAPEVHALCLGAVTSASRHLGPQPLIGRIFGGHRGVRGDEDLPNEHIQALFDHWRTLTEDREAGRARLAPLAVSVTSTARDLLSVVKQRRRELTWYVRGVHAAGDDPIESDPAGRDGLEAIVSASACLSLYVALELPTTGSAAAFEETSRALRALLATVDDLITDLVELSRVSVTRRQP